MTPLSHTEICIRKYPFLWIFAAFFALAGLAGAQEEDRHWSLRPIEKPKTPESVNPVDHWITKKLEDAGGRQNPAADRHTLLRRASLDLTGLPPSRAEMAEFISDKSDTAWSSLVDRLLDSPHYGERWGRHWLDVARYVQGTVKVPGIDEIDLAAPYRDYVVRAFNRDKPYDEFIREQIAGDLLADEANSTESKLDMTVAPAFLSIGPWFEECTDPNKLRLDIIDEQISTATRAFLAHDFACSRCHDHKYDPIPTRDYYALAGIFRSTEITSEFASDWKDGRPREVIPLAEPELLAKYEAQQAEEKRLLSQRRETLEIIHKETLLPRMDFPAAGKLPNEILSWEAEDFDGHKNLRTISSGRDEVIETRKALDRWVKYRVILPEAGDYTLLIRYASVLPAPVVLELDLKDEPERILQSPTFGVAPDLFRWQPVALKGLEKGSLHIRLKVDRNEPFPVLDSFRLVRGTLDPDDVTWRRKLGIPSLADTHWFLSAEEKAGLEKLDEKISELRKNRIEPEFTLGVRDAATPVNLPIHIGGDVYQTEEEITPRAVPTLGWETDSLSVGPKESGRRQFAEWLTHPEHPLTARVMVNRIWHWHFGTGLVRTTDDFGKQGSAPTHPELLDWLAAEFIESGWSIKHINRVILNSATYRTSSGETPENKALDPDGQLLSRFPKRRLEVEAIYDSMLSSIGKVPRQETGGDLDTSLSKDRALYILTSSRSPMGLGMEIRKMFPLFGFDSSGRPIHDRDESITPEQALWWLNNPLPEYYASKLAEQLLADYPDATERTIAAHEITLGRPPGEQSEQAFLAYIDHLQDEGASEQNAWSRACLGLFSTRSFQTID